MLVTSVGMLNYLRRKFHSAPEKLNRVDSLGLIAMPPPSSQRKNAFRTKSIFYKMSSFRYCDDVPKYWLEK